MGWNTTMNQLIIQKKIMFTFFISSIFFYSCDTVKIIEKKIPEKFKGKGIYIVEIKSAYLNENDFGRTLLGNPLPIILSIKENNVLIWKTSIGQKKRGNINLKQKTILSYNPESIYEFSFAEEGIISKSSKYIKKYDKGEWAFDEGTIYLGDKNESWFELDSYWVPSMPYEKNNIYKK